MKIGVLTFHRAENFGAVLQCFALISFLSSLNYDVEVVDYRNANIEKGYKLFNFNFVSFRAFLGSLKNNMLSFKSRWKKKNRYKIFRKKYLKISKKTFTKENFRNNYDCLICGSDQIWNLRLTGGYDNVYFLDFETNAKKIAYAASSEEKDYEKIRNFKSRIARAFGDFKALSVREFLLADYIKLNLGFYASVVLDPTFLISSKEYFSIAQKPKESGYIFVYHLINSTAASQYADILSQKSGKKIIEFTAGFSTFAYKKHTIMNSLGPEELLGFILYSDFVVTTSFHGTALSLINQKQFYVIDEGTNVRIKSLLASVDLSERLLPKSITEFTEKTINYDDSGINKKLLNLIESSKCYLTQNL